MELMVYARPGEATATATWRLRRFDCLIGEAGAIQTAKKTEGDGATPIGTWPMLLGFYRSDRIERPRGDFPWRAIQPGDAFCDDSSDPLYNNFVWAPHPAVKTGTLWKEGDEYDVAIWLGYNVAPVVPNKGSAILIHGWKPDVRHTRGCIALPRDQLIAIADDVTFNAKVRIICY